MYPADVQKVVRLAQVPVDDLLNSVITPMGSNFGNTVLTNIGSMENKGVEFNLNFIPVQTKDLSELQPEAT